MYVCMCVLRVTHLDQSSYSPRILAVSLRLRSNVVRRPFVVRLTSTGIEIRRGALVCRKFDRVRIFHCRVHSTYRSDATFMLHTTGERSAKRGRRLESRERHDYTFAARYSLSNRMLLLLYYSLQTRSRRAVREIDHLRGT